MEKEHLSCDRCGNHADVDGLLFVGDPFAQDDLEILCKRCYDELIILGEIKVCEKCGETAYRDTQKKECIACQKGYTDEVRPEDVEV